MRSTGGADGPPLFVVGCGRSGTTMLRMMLTSHPDLAIPWESHFIVPLWKRREEFGGERAPDVERALGFITSTSMYRLWEVPEEVLRGRVDALVRPSLAELVEAVFLAYADHRSRRRWGDKTPAYVLWIPMVSHLFPTARFVHVIRDGRDVALSYMSVPWGPNDVWGCAVKWRRDVGVGRRQGAAIGTDRYLEIRYEQLVREPRTALERICDFAGLGFDERMLADDEAKRSVGSRAGRSVFHASATKPPATGMRDWRTQMPARQLLAFESVAGDLLSELGYERRHASIPRRARVRAAAGVALVAGRDLGSKVKRRSLRLVGGARGGLKESPEAAGRPG